MMSTALSSIVSDRAETFTVTRPTESKGDMGAYEETTVTHDEDIYVYSPRHVSEQVARGEQQTGSLRALADPTADVQKDDRITHGSVAYEVLADPEGIPDDSSPEVLQFDLTRVVN